MNHKYRTNYCGYVKETEVENSIVLSGWIENIRDHGGVIFVDLRDETGTIQLVSNDDSIFDDITRESVVKIEGIVRKREEEDYNNNLATGTIEVVVDKLEILSKAKNVLPFEIITSHEVSEDVRLKYRYLDLRNKKVHDTIILRSKLLKFLRDKMNELGFMEVQTPIITASSPEGARDFIIPSRKYHGKFYALPQAPQIFKQLLMVGGFDKYFQIAPCFRDEDCRSDRTLEFYQLDFEMAFVEEEDVYKIGEEIFYDIFTNFGDKEVTSKPFPRISYQEAMLKYGTDKPDLRNPLVIQDVSELFKDSEFKPFRGTIVRAIVVDEIANQSNSWFNEVVDYAKKIGMPGIGYLSMIDNQTFKGPIDKFLTSTDRITLIEKTGLKINSVIFFIADKKENTCAKQAGLIRDKLGKKLDLIDFNKYEFCIINDFPMYEYNEERGEYDFGHNPFSMPKGGLSSLKNQKIEEIKAFQYDFVCNGNEMASGAVRNHEIATLKKAFELAGYDEDTVKTKFQSLYNAFQYGCPPHAGMAPGIDRILMLLKGEENLREVQAFPMSVSGQDFMMGCPSTVTEMQLKETHIKIR